MDWHCAAAASLGGNRVGQQGRPNPEQLGPTGGAPGHRCGTRLTDPTESEASRNLLRRYVSFSAPRSEGYAVGRVLQEDATGKHLTGALLAGTVVLTQEDRLPKSTAISSPARCYVAGAIIGWLSFGPQANSSADQRPSIPSPALSRRKEDGASRLVLAVPWS